MLTQCDRRKIPADLKAVDAVRNDFEQFLHHAGITEDDRVGWVLTFSEIVNNSIIHGSKGDASRFVTVEWWVEDKRIYLGVEDSGEGPPRERLEKPELPEDIYSENGRGLFLISSFADEWRHWYGHPGYRQVIYKEHAHVNEVADSTVELERTLDELSACYESISAFYQLGSMIISSHSLNSFIRQGLESLSLAHGIDFAVAVLTEKMEPQLEKELQGCPQVVKEKGYEDVLKPLREGEVEYVWGAEEKPEASVLAPYNNGCCLPVEVEGKALGYLVAARVNPADFFNAGDINLLRTFADLLGIALANHNLREISAREQRALRELEIATDIQKNLLPITVPELSVGQSLYMNRLSAREVAGDYASAVVDSNGRLLLAVIDVMGKGVSAALFASIFRTAFEMQVEKTRDLTELITEINENLCQQLGELTMFITCAIVRVDIEKKTLEIVNAGHCPVLLWDRGELVEELEPSGPPLGLFSDSEYETVRRPLKNGTGLLLVTDGLYEWDLEEVQFGWEQLTAMARKHIPEGAGTLWEAIRSLMVANMGEDELASDDQTMVYWKYEG